MPVYFYNPGALVWLWTVPAIAALFIHAAIRRREAIRAFGADAAFLSRRREAVGSCIAAALAVLALARPAWDLQEQQLQETGRDVIFLLDVSRSMMAEDLHPTRLEHAKTAILDCVEDLSGDRVGLVLFAGSAEIRCPLTIDYDYFRMALRQAAPDSVAVGGTMIAHAVERTLDKLIDAEKPGMQDVILITDGEDLIEGADELEAARQLGDAGVRLISIGIGDRSRGSRIRLEDEETGRPSFLKHGNTEVWTRLQSETLRRMTAAVPDGIYFDVANGPFDLARIYRQIMEHALRESTGAQVMERYEDRYHLFLAGAAAVLLLVHRWRVRAVPFLVCVLLFGQTAAANPSRRFREANRAYAEGRYDEAINAYTDAAMAAPEAAEIMYNLGHAQYRTGAFAEAAGSFEYAASLADSVQLRSRCWYNLGNCMVRTGEALRESDPHAAAAYCQQAAWFYRTALDDDAAFADAAYNLELTRLIAFRIEEEIREQQEQEQQENELIRYIREKLQEFIERQAALIESQDTGALQRQLERETRELAAVMAESGLHTDLELPDGTPVPGPLRATYEHTLKAAEAMARPDQATAQAELIAALGAAPADPDQQNGDSDEEPEDYGEDMDYEASDEDADMYEEADPFGDFSEYEEIRGLPPPNKTEMDILAEEVRNQERRRQKKAGEYKAVERDW